MIDITGRSQSPCDTSGRWFHWALLLPAACALVVAARLPGATGVAYSLLLGIGLLGAVIAAVHHSEVVAQRIGEPYGTLVLALSAVVRRGSVEIGVGYKGSQKRGSLTCRASGLPGSRTVLRRRQWMWIVLDSH